MVRQKRKKREKYKIINTDTELVEISFRHSGKKITFKITPAGLKKIDIDKYIKEIENIMDGTKNDNPWEEPSIIDFSVKTKIDGQAIRG